MENSGTRPRRICFPFIGTTVGGAHISHLLIAAHLDAGRYESLFALHDRRGFMKEYMERRGVPFSLLPDREIPRSMKDFLPHRWKNIARIIKDIRCFLREREIDLVQAPDGIERILWQAAARMEGIPYLHSQRTAVAKRFSPEKMLSYALMDYIVSNSQTTRESLPVTATKKQSVVYPALDSAIPVPVRAGARRGWEERLGIPAHARIVGFLGNFTSQKRPLFFLAIAALLKSRENPSAPLYFVMAGNDYGSFIPQMREVAEREGFGDRLRICPFNQDPLDFLAACDILIAPARNEAFGRVLIEAMYAGTPVIASDDAGHREIILNDSLGRMAMPEDPGAFCNAAEFLLNDAGAYAHIASVAQAHVLEKHTEKTQAQKFMGIYDAILAQK
jgi:glycosyltransferase involved in cell wall biosynthesis